MSTDLNDLAVVLDKLRYDTETLHPMLDSDMSLLVTVDKKEFQMPIVPNLYNKTVQQAHDTITAAGFVAGAIGPSGNAGNHTVIGQYPWAGVDAMAGSPIEITIRCTQVSEADVIVWGT